MKKVIYLVLLTVLVFSCHSKKRRVEEKITHSSQPSSIANTPKNLLLTPSFSIRLALSKKAERRLRKTDETIIVATYLTGLPKNEKIASDGSLEQLNLSTQEIELSWQDEVAVFEDLKVSPETFKTLADTNYRVLVNVYSGRKSHDRNILTGDVLEGTVDEIIGKEHLLKVDLL